MQFNYLYERLIQEGYEYSCIMLGITGSTKREMIDFANTINEYDLEEGDNLGRELDPHITILYGIHTSNFNMMEKILKQYDKFTIDFTITGVSLFKNEDYDVLKYDIESEDLTRLNKLFRQLDHTNNYPDYHPHATIAYIRSGYAEPYLNPTKIDGIKQTSNEIRMSNPDNQQKVITL